MSNVSTKYLRGMAERCPVCGNYRDMGGYCGSDKPKCHIKYLMECGFTRKEARMAYNQFKLEGKKC